MNNRNTNHYGVGVTGLLGVAFILLKLTHVIDWSWWWVTSPFWIPVGLGLVFIVIGAVLKAIVDRGES